MKSMRVIVFSKASFLNAPELKSQLGYIIPMADDSHHANIIHYGSSECHRAMRLVMAAEIHALIHAVDIFMLI